MNLHITEENKLLLDEISEKKEVSKSVLVNKAIEEAYASRNSMCRLRDEELDYIINYFSKSSLGINLRLNAREAAVDTQILMEMANAYANDKPIKFASIFNRPSKLFLSAKNAVNFKINEAKKRKELL